MAKQLFSEMGIPDKVISDNGRHFDSQQFRKFTSDWGLDHITSSPNYPQSNGLIERQIQTVKQALKKAKSSCMDPDLALLCLRTTPIDSVIPSPAEMLFTRKIKGNLPVRIRNVLPNHNDIYNRLKDRQDIQKSYYDRNTRDLPPLIKGQPVHIQNSRGTWDPAIVQQQCIEPRSYVVSTESGMELRRNRKHIRESTGRHTLQAEKGEEISDHEKVSPTVSEPLPQKKSFVPSKSSLLYNSQTPSETVTTRYGRVVRKPERY